MCQSWYSISIIFILQHVHIIFLLFSCYRTQIPKCDCDPSWVQFSPVLPTIDISRTEFLFLFSFSEEQLHWGSLEPSATTLNWILELKSLSNQKRLLRNWVRNRERRSISTKPKVLWRRISTVTRPRWTQTTGRIREVRGRGSRGVSRRDKQGGSPTPPPQSRSWPSSHKRSQETATTPDSEGHPPSVQHFSY